MLVLGGTEWALRPSPDSGWGEVQVGVNHHWECQKVTETQEKEGDGEEEEGGVTLALGR